MSVLRFAPNYPPLKCRCLINIINRMKPAYSYIMKQTLGIWGLDQNHQLINHHLSSIHPLRKNLTSRAPSYSRNGEGRERRKVPSKQSWKKEGSSWMTERDEDSDAEIINPINLCTGVRSVSLAFSMQRPDWLIDRLTNWIDSPRRWQWGGEECGGACCATSARPMRWWGTWSCPPRCLSCFRRNVASRAAQMHFPEVRTTNNCISSSKCCVCSLNPKLPYSTGRTLVQSLPGLGRNRELYAGCWWQHMLDC